MNSSDDLLPPHRALLLPGVHGYTHIKSVAAGDAIDFHVSADVPYTLSVCKPAAVGDREADDVLHVFPEHGAQVQPIHPGSYVAIGCGLAQDAFLGGASFEAWVMPWSFGRQQAILGQFDGSGDCGYGLFITPDGAVELYLGDGGAFNVANVVRSPVLAPRVWQHIVATWDGRTAAIWIDGQRTAERDLDVVPRPGHEPMRLASAGAAGVADDFLDADLAMPAIYAHALGQHAIARRFAERGVVVASDALACWPLQEQHGATLHDCSGNDHHGRVVNHATWRVNGPACDPARVPVLQETTPPYDPRRDAQRGHAIRFARDDLYDCRWQATHSHTLPASLRSGIYVGRITYQHDGAARAYDITFIVTKAKNVQKAPLLVLCSTATWLTYSVSPFGVNSDAPLLYPRRGGPLPNAHPDAPDYSLYRAHHAGQPSYHAGLRMPWPNASPDACYALEGTGFAQWARLELHLHFWLDQCGYDYDVVSDFDLHRDPGLLAGYRTVIINGHSEYWSIPAYDGLDRYLAQGGTAVVLSGNSLCARVSYNDDMTVMEERKTGSAMRAAPGAGSPGGEHGEQYHSDDGLRGGPLRQTSRAGGHLIGLDTAGWGFAEAADFGVYQVRQPDHFLFTTPAPVLVTAGQTFGHAAGGALPRAVGHEWDLTFKTLKQMTAHVPDGCMLPPDHANIDIIAVGIRAPGKLDTYLDYFYQPTTALDGLSCEMIYWERPQGGRVFNAGTVCASWVLGADPVFEGLLANVLHHFISVPV